jgi:hypothetical protein
MARIGAELSGLRRSRPPNASPMSDKVVCLKYKRIIINIALKQLTQFRKKRKVAAWMF